MAASQSHALRLVRGVATRVQMRGVATAWCKWKAEQRALAFEVQRRKELNAKHNLAVRLVRAALARWQILGVQKAWSQWNMHCVGVKHSHALSKSRQNQLEGDLAKMTSRVASLSTQLQSAQQDKATRRILAFAHVARRAVYRGYRMALRSWLSFCSKIDLTRYVLRCASSCLYLLSRTDRIVCASLCTGPRFKSAKELCVVWRDAASAASAAP